MPLPLVEVSEGSQQQGEHLTRLKIMRGVIGDEVKRLLRTPTSRHNRASASAHVREPPLGRRQFA
jgi:hypothetical protein